MEEFDFNDKKNKIGYRIKTATSEKICIHLKKCDNDFLHPLSGRLKIDDYAKKLFEKSITFEAWSGYSLVGLVAAYFNDFKHQTGYISNVSVMKNYKGMGIASELMRQCIEYAKLHKFKEIKLEVHQGSNQARHLYNKFGFIYSGKKDDFIQII